METGTSSALISGASSAGLYLATDSGTRIELTGNAILETGRVTTHSNQTSTVGAVNTATDGYGAYEIAAIDPTQANDTTTTLTLPDGVVGGERYTVTCVAVGNNRPPPPGVDLYGRCIISGTILAGSDLTSPTVTSITGASATGANAMEVVKYEFIWFNAAGAGGEGIPVGWMYNKTVM